MPLRYQVKAEFSGNINEKVVQKVLLRLAEFDVYLKNENNFFHQLKRIIEALNGSDQLYFLHSGYSFIENSISFDLQFYKNITVDKFTLSMNIDVNCLNQESRHRAENFDWAWYLTIFLNTTRDFKLLSINTYIGD